jgi:hypothetical protein
VKVYSIQRNKKTGKVLVEVESFEIKGEVIDVEVHFLVHVGNHSPDGFSYGYSGSGPADLAWSILACHLEESNLSNLEQRTGHFLSQRLHQQFKEDVIARMDQSKDLHTLYEVEILTWLSNKGWQSRVAEYKEKREAYREDVCLYSKLENELVESPQTPEGMDRDEWDAKHSVWNDAFHRIVAYEEWLNETIRSKA